MTATTRQLNQHGIRQADLERFVGSAYPYEGVDEEP